MEKLPVFLLLFILLSGCGGTPEKQVPAGTFDLSHAHIAGNAGSPTLIIEYSDFECPYCAKAAPADHELLAKYGGRIKFVFKHFPLNSGCNDALSRPMHQGACLAAEASECASDQGKFWEYHDALFEENLRTQSLFSSPNFSRDNLIQMAKSFGLDTTKFASCLDSGSKLQLIREDAAEGVRVGVQGTPTVFINGTMKTGLYSLSAWEQALGFS